MDNECKYDKKKSFSIRTDLAIESRELLEEKESDLSDGIEFESRNENGIQITSVRIINENGAEAMGKPIGSYITIETDDMKSNDVSLREDIIKITADSIASLVKLDKDSTVLIVGLGNWNITPDALGPKVISRVLVSRHIMEEIPEEINNKVRPVAAISPGVMGITGIETGEIIKGVVEKLKPALVIAVDALAARKTSRINSTIQMTDTGVNPGSGVGNTRMPLNKDTLGIPVIAIGVPTVVDAATLVNDTMDRMLDDMISQTKEGEAFYKMLKNLESEEKYGLITEILNPYAQNMFVTPKEVDIVIDRLSNIISNSINIALHPGITKDDISRFA